MSSIPDYPAKANVEVIPSIGFEDFYAALNWANLAHFSYCFLSIDVLSLPVPSTESSPKVVPVSISSIWASSPNFIVFIIFPTSVNLVFSLRDQ